MRKQVDVTLDVIAVVAIVVVVVVVVDAVTSPTAVAAVSSELSAPPLPLEDGAKSTASDWAMPTALKLLSKNLVNCDKSATTRIIVIQRLILGFVHLFWFDDHL